jgi:hypothetical protein
MNNIQKCDLVTKIYEKKCIMKIFLKNNEPLLKTHKQFFKNHDHFSKIINQFLKIKNNFLKNHKKIEKFMDHF